MQFGYERLAKVQVRGDRTERQTASFSPIRMTLILVEPIDGRFHEQLTNPEGPLARVVNYLEKTLRVRPIRGNFTIPPACDEHTHGENEGKCAHMYSTTKCGIFDVPERFIGTREVCSTPNGGCYESGPDGAGAANMDFLLFVGTSMLCISYSV